MPNGRVIDKTKVRIVSAPETVILALEERGFCAVLDINGKTTKKESKNIDEFRKIIKPSSIAWIDYVVDNFEREVPKIGSTFGFSELLIKKLLKSQRSAYEDFENEMGMILPAIIVEGSKVTLDPLLILIKKKMIVTLHTTEVKRFFRLRKYAETMLKKLPSKALKKDKITLLLIRILDESNTRNFDHLREIEEYGDKLSNKMTNLETPREFIGKQIHEMKHALIVYLGGLWATIDVLNELRYGDAALISDDPKIINKLSALITEVNLHISLAEHLSDVLASGLEVLQSIYNNQLQILNNRLALLVAYLTIIGTALLVPNTIATVMGSPMFDVNPKDLSWYLPLLVVSTLVATLAAWLFVKKTGLLPERPDSG